MMANPIQARVSAKRCFVTIGATAPFNSLIKGVLATDFIRELQRAGYTELRIQYGDHEGEAIFTARKDELKTTLEADIKVDVTGFGFDRTGLNKEIAAVKGHSAETEGMIISHAGSGSVLDVLRVGIPLVVVPNADLLHNHQVELAEALAQQDYVIYGKLDDLKSSISETETLRRKMRKWPPLRSGEEKYENGIADVLAEEMGWQLD
ncbi:N-acetylglucosaminyldiphosphodolichol N-acetylglucosaminyltransferase catalytic subunit alg13 [Exophiala xenobiotica]|nr:N-acetylglucosaminyldiphosphodolichol N-acetylglucosaminyltransferase catalytic subunit alg13 [Exophiala xenobiotica]